MSHENNSIKDQLLGMPHGTANNKLRKNIIFWLANLNRMLACYRCKEQIESVDDLSIEHKTPWQGAANPKESFFDMGNISFSHLKCNIGEPRRAKTHCLNGHVFDKVEDNGWRSCSICLREGNTRRSRERYDPDVRRKKYITSGH